MSNNKIAGTYEVSPAAGYAGNVAPSTAWKILNENKDAVLIDVRTRAEWNYVGLPELASARNHRWRRKSKKVKWLSAVGPRVRNVKMI